MSGLRSRVVMSVGVHLHDDVSIDLRGSLETTAFLAIGDTIEIVLGESHLKVLREQSDAALSDMALLKAADDVLGDAYEAGAQARTAAALARVEAESARRAGAEQQAVSADEAAECALRAAEQAQAAVRTAVEAMEAADEAAEQARSAALAARVAAVGG
ncbi:hypothetical protein [Saccharothrix sp. HUAS TT1]|uniref:hypothetical protein n=1 Tax=unclassified Saccharothrix TaxID=2593673 RepID=UPI00345B8A5F